MGVKKILYPKYQGVLRENLSKFSKIDQQFNGKKSYAASIIENLRILLTWASDDEKQMIHQMISDYEQNKSAYENHALICSVLIASLKCNTSIKKAFEQYGASYDIVREILGVKSEYYGGLGAYQDRWFELRPKLCSSDTAVEDVTPEKIFKNVISTPQGYQTFANLSSIINDRLGQSNVGPVDISAVVPYI